MGATLENRFDPYSYSSVEFLDRARLNRPPYSDQSPISAINATTVDSTPARTAGPGEILNNGE